jgi:hypothetical protein
MSDDHVTHQRSTPNEDGPPPVRKPNYTGSGDRVGPASGEFHPPADAADVYEAGGNPGEPAAVYNPHPPAA